MQERASTTAGTNQKHPLSPPESDVARPLPDVRLHMMHVQFLAHPNGSRLTCAAKRLLIVKTSTNTIND